MIGGNDLVRDSPVADGRGTPESAVRPTRRHFLILALAWTFFVAYGSWVPFEYRSNSIADAVEQFWNLPPVSVGIGTRADWASNVLLFIPLTFCWMGALTCDRGRGARIAAALALIPAAVFTSFVVELGQYWFIRNPAKNDLAAESLGGVIGVVLWLFEGQRIVGWLREYGRARTASAQVTWLLQAYVVLFVLFSLQPMDLTISLGDLYYKYKSGHVVLIPFTFEFSSLSAVVYQFFADIASFVPVGAWLAARQRHRESRYSLQLLGVIGGAGISAAIEAAQFLVLSRYTDTTDIVLGTFGVWLGVRLAGRDWQESPSAVARGGRQHAGTARLLAFIAGYSLFLMIGFWFPFDIRLDRQAVRVALDGFFRVPFYALYWGSVFNATTQALLRVILFAPVGALCGSLVLKSRSAAGRHLLQLVSLIYVAMLAFGIELVQTLMPSRVADSTEVLFCVAGGALGLWLRMRPASAHEQASAPTHPTRT